MLRVCCVCPEEQNVIAEISPLADKSMTHTYCRFHELEALEQGKIITPNEQKELTTIRFKRMRAGFQ